MNHPRTSTKQLQDVAQFVYQAKLCQISNPNQEGTVTQALSGPSQAKTPYARATSPHSYNGEQPVHEVPVDLEPADSLRHLKWIDHSNTPYHPHSYPYTHADSDDQL